MPNGLLPPLRGPPCRPPGALGEAGRGAAGALGAAGTPGRGGMRPGPGRGAWTPPSAGGWRRCLAALTAAACSALSAAARASAAATSMSWALAGLIVGAGGGVGTALGARFGGAGLAGATRPSPTRTSPMGLGGPAGPGAGPAGATGVGGGLAGTGAATNTSRSRRATGASTVLDADLTNSPISLSLASTTLLSTPSSLASSCTRALPATALLTPRPRGQVSRGDLTRALEAWSFQGLHRVLMSVVLPCCPGEASHLTSGGSECCRARYSASGPVSTTPARRSARPKARRRSACARHAGSGCMFAPRPGRLRAGSGTTTPCSSATTRNNSEAGARPRQPTHVRVGDARHTTARVYRVRPGSPNYPYPNDQSQPRPSLPINRRPRGPAG